MIFWGGCCQIDDAKQSKEQIRAGKNHSCHAKADKKGKKTKKEQIHVAAAVDEGFSAQDLMDPARGIPISARGIVQAVPFSARATLGKLPDVPAAMVDCPGKLMDVPTSARAAPGEVRAITPSTSEGSLSVRTEASMDEEARQAEKERLHQMVISFSREAVKGLKCQVLGATAGKCVTAEFSLDSWDRMIVDDGSKKLLIRFEDVQEVYPYGDLMEAIPESQIGQQVMEADRSRAIFVQHRGHELPESWMCLIVTDEAEVERFIACLNILQLHAQAKMQSKEC